jgi:hypothetical protein
VNGPNPAAEAAGKAPPAAAAAAAPAGPATQGAAAVPAGSSKDKDLAGSQPHPPQHPGAPTEAPPAPASKP